MALRSVQTPAGMILLPEEEAANLGFPPVDFGAPALPPPMESPVPDVALAPPLPDAVTGAGEVAPQGLAMPAPTAAPIAPPPVAPEPVAPAPEAPPPASEPAKSLSATTYDEFANRADRDTQQQVAAAQQVGEAEAAKAQAEAQAMAERDAMAQQKAAEMDAARAADEAAIAQKAKVWEGKQQEWMASKVTRRGMNMGELIGGVIAGLGSAMKGQGGQNPALPLIMGKIQQDVDDQIRERDQLGAQVSALKGSVDYAREVASNQQAQRLAAYGLEMTRASNVIDTTAKSMEPGVKRGLMQQSAAALRSEGTQKYGQALQLQHGEDQAAAARAQQERDSRRASGVAYARLAFDKEKDARDFDLNLQQLAEAKAQRVAAAATAADKEAAAREVPDLFAEVKNPDGTTTRAPYRARNEKAGDEVSELKASRDLIDATLADAVRIRSSFKNFEAFRNSPEFQRYTSKITASQLAMGKLLGTGAYDKGTAEALGNVYGGKPFAGTNASDLARSMFSTTNPESGVEAARVFVNDKFNFEANARRDPRHGVYAPITVDKAKYDKPVTTKTDEAVSGFITSKTPDDIRGAAKPGLAARSFQVLGDAPTNKQRAAEGKINEVADASTGGVLTKAQSKVLDTQTAKAQSGDPVKVAEARKSLVAAATGALAKGQDAKGQQAIDRLALLGDEEGLAEVAAALTAGAKSEREIEQRLAPIKFARMQADMVRRPSPYGRPAAPSPFIPVTKAR